MIERHEIRYARAADGVHIAYQAFGVGRLDILFVPGQITHLDLQQEDPEIMRWFGQLARIGRVISIDRRGVGLSDRLSPDDLPPAEVLAEDLAAVLDAAGSTAPVLLLGFAEGGQIASLFAALHPDRVAGLILYAVWPYVPDDLRPGWERWMEWAPPRWGSIELAMSDTREVSPSHADDPSYVDFVSRVQRSALSPNSARPLFELSLALDVRDILPTIGTPTLVLHREHDSAQPVELLRLPAELIPAARLVVLPGEDHWITCEPQQPMFDAIEEFVESLGAVPHPAGRRRLATVLFTDIVRSTQRSAELGDAAWKHALEAHHGIVRTALARHDGREIGTAGDGFFATFDGPAAACRSALEMMTVLKEVGLQIRAGVHTGEVEVIDGEIGGLGVTIGARIGAIAGASELLCSSTVKDLTAGTGLTFENAGEHELKGVPDTWRLYRVVA